MKLTMVGLTFKNSRRAWTRAHGRLRVFCALLVMAGGSILATAAEYAVVISQSAWADPGWRSVAETLEKKHTGQVFKYAEALEDASPALREAFPRYICFVAPPKEVTRAFVAKAHRLTRALDSDPYVDCRWAILTGYDSTNALRTAQRAEPLIIRKAVSGTPMPLEAFEEGVWFSELDAGRMQRKAKGQAPVDETGPQDSTGAIVDSLNRFRPDLFVTSGHATERDWQIGYRYRNGYFRCANGALYGEDTKKQKLPVNSPNPKVYLAVGNCLMGHIDSLDAMALAFLNSAGVHQMAGYTVNTWYGYAGWGCLDYFVEQPGRFSLAEAVRANDLALVHRLQTYFPESANADLNLDHPTPPATTAVSEAAKKAGLSAQDAFGLLYDRDALAFYGDPAWEAKLAPGNLRWDQELSEKEGVWTFEVKPRSGELSFSAGDKNGSQRGGRPFIQFLPRRLKPTQVLEGAELNPVIADDFILVPNPLRCEPEKVYRVRFKEQ